MPNSDMHFRCFKLQSFRGLIKLSKQSLKKPIVISNRQILFISQSLHLPFSYFSVRFIVKKRIVFPQPGTFVWITRQSIS